MVDWKEVQEIADRGNPAPDRTVTRTDEEWRSVLSKEQYDVLRRSGTERPFSSEMCGLFSPGIYACAACGTVLFDSQSKFESGTGWPSFSAPVKDNVVSYHVDRTHGMVRVEARCNTCNSHLGHVFPDGPKPTGLRYCMNALALRKLAA